MTTSAWTLRQTVSAPTTEEVAHFLQRSPGRGPKRQRLFTEKDLFLMVQHAVLSLAAATMPEGWWPGICRITSFKRRITRRRRELAPFRAKLNDVLRVSDEAELTALYDTVQARRDQRHLTYLRERSPRRSVTTRVLGGAYLDASLAKRGGRGLVELARTWRHNHHQARAMGSWRARVPTQRAKSRLFAKPVRRAERQSRPDCGRGQVSRRAHLVRWR